MDKEIEKFIKWCVTEIKENDMVTLGAYRFVAENSEQKKSVITPLKWLSKMASAMTTKKGISITGVDVAKDFNKLIESGDIQKFVGRSNKRLAEDVAIDYQNLSKEEFREKYLSQQEESKHE